MTAAEPGDPTSEDAAMGPLSSADRRGDACRTSSTGRSPRAREIVAGGDRNGQLLLRAPCWSESRPDNDAYREEFFGPVASVYRVGSEEEAIELANDTPFGLGSYVFSDDPEQALRVADALDTGMVYVNGVGLDGAELPFGGVKRSGFGRELGRYGIEEFVNKKLIRVVK